MTRVQNGSGACLSLPNKNRIAPYLYIINSAPSVASSLPQTPQYTTTPVIPFTDMDKNLSNAQTKAHVKKIVAKMMENVITAANHADQNKTNKFLLLPDLVMANIVQKLGVDHQIDPTNIQTIMPLCSNMYDFMKKNKLNKNIQQGSIKECCIEFLNLLEPILVHNSYTWLSVNIMPMITLNTTENGFKKEYTLVFPFSLSIIKDDARISNIQILHGLGDVPIYGKRVDQKSVRLEEWKIDCSEIMSNIMFNNLPINDIESVFIKNIFIKNTSPRTSPADQPFNMDFFVNIENDSMIMGNDDDNNDDNDDDDDDDDNDDDDASQHNSDIYCKLKQQLHSLNKSPLSYKKIAAIRDWVHTPGNMLRIPEDHHYGYKNRIDSRYYLKVLETIFEITSWWLDKGVKISMTTIYTDSPMNLPTGSVGGSKYNNKKHVLVEQRVIDGRKRNIYKYNKKLHIKRGNDLVLLKDFLNDLKKKMIKKTTSWSATMK
jgi:hypothetical protein